MARTLSFKSLRQQSRAEQEQPRLDAARIGLPARDGARRRAGVHVRGRRRRRRRRDRPRSRSAARGRAASSSALVDAAPPGVEARPVDGVIGQVPPALVELALWIADYYGSTPARALALVAPELPKRRKEQAPPAERQALGGEAEPLELAPEQIAAVTRIVEAMDAGGGNLLLYGATGSRQDRGLPPGVRGGARARPRRDRARAGDRARAADGRPRARPLRRPRRDPALGAHRRRAARRARADRERRGAHRRRRALGDLRARRRARPDRRRRGARPVVQAGLRPALRRAHGRREARVARGRGRGLRLGDAAAGELGGARAALARRPDRRRRCRRCASSTCGARPAIRSRRRCSRRCAGSPSGAARRSCCSTGAGSRRRSTAAPAARPSAARTATSRSSCTATRRFAATTAATRRTRARTAASAGRPTSRGSAPARRSSSASCVARCRSSS